MQRSFNSIFTNLICIKINLQFIFNRLPSIIAGSATLLGSILSDATVCVCVMIGGDRQPYRIPDLLLVVGLTCLPLLVIPTILPFRVST